MSNINYEKFETYLRKTLPSLNIGLNMIDINAKINDSNPVRIDFYDKKSSNLLHSKDFKEAINTFDYILMFEDRDIFRVSFKDSFGQKVECANFCGNNTVKNSCVVRNDEGYELDITVQVYGKGIQYFSILEYNPNEYYVTKWFRIDEEGTMHCELDNIPHYSVDTVAKDIKNISVTSPLYTHNPVISIFGRKQDNIKTIYCDKDGLSTARRNPTYNFDYMFNQKTYKKELDNILCHPWNKQVLEYTMDEFEKKFPGFKEFIAYNFSLYNHIMNTEYDPNTESGGIVDSTIGDMEAIPKYVNGITKVKKDAN